MNYYLFKEKERALDEHGAIGFMQIDDIQQEHVLQNIVEMLSEHFDTVVTISNELMNQRDKKNINLSDFSDWWEFNCYYFDCDEKLQISPIIIYQIFKY